MRSYSIVITTKVKGLKNGSRIYPLILNLEPRHLYPRRSVVNTPPPGVETQNSVWTLWNKQKTVASTGIQTLDFPACTPVAKPTGLSRLLTKNVEEIFALQGC